MERFLPRKMPPGLEALIDLTLDLRWTWNGQADALFRRIDPATWDLAGNPWALLQGVPQPRLEQLAADPGFHRELEAVLEARSRSAGRLCWCEREHPAGAPEVAYFSMEFGLGEALPLYAGGLGVLAGDHLKASSDLGVPVTGVGLLYQEGYFRQTVDGSGRQVETYLYNDPTSLPVQPVLDPGGAWLRVSLELPGRTLWLRVWRVQVGRCELLLLDANDLLNAPLDRGITAKLYGGDPEIRLLQEMALGIGGWRALEATGRSPEVCHINEGHAAFAALERIRGYRERTGASFREALWATRAGNVFTTHTAVAAGLDTFSPEILLHNLTPALCARLGLEPGDVLALGRADPRDASEPFRMPYLALRTSARANGVSLLHGEVSRRLFESLWPRRPVREIPIGHVTNGVHVPSWASKAADDLWAEEDEFALRAREPGTLRRAVERVDDARLWALRKSQRGELVRYARVRLGRQLAQRGARPEGVLEAAHVLDPEALTLGFARRFAEYKRPNLLLTGAPRLERLLLDPARPVQIIVAGKAHPADELGKSLVAEWVRFVQRVRARAVFLEDYDMALAQHLVAGVDVWLNTPRRPWEACGTSGMKVLVNGGLNLSTLDGWWAEAYAEGLGWAIAGGGGDAEDGAELLELLEREVVPEFYGRDERGLPARWLARMRASLTCLAPELSADRMVREYLEGSYLPASADYRARAAEGGRLARALAQWDATIDAAFGDLRFDSIAARREGEAWMFEVRVEAGRLPSETFRVELYAEPEAGGQATIIPLRETARTNASVVFEGAAPATRPAEHYTPRAVPYHPSARIPAEGSGILWAR